MSKKNKNKSEATMPETTNDTTEVDVAETIEETVIPEPVVEVPTIAAQEETVTLTPEEAELIGLINTYRNSIKAGGGLKRDPQNTVNFINICTFLIRKDKIKLYQKFYEEVFKNDVNNLMDGKVVFQHLHSIQHSDKNKVEMLYTAFSTLNSYLGKAKKTAFPLDFNLLSQKYGGDALVATLKGYLQM